MPELCLAQEPEADALISHDAFALLIGMILDQQIPLERAFAAPAELRRRLGGDLTVDQIASYDTDELQATFATPPALHRFPKANADRVQALAHIVQDQYDGDAASIWTTAPNGAELLRRIHALPGFGERKARIFVALLGKQCGVRPEGWQAACSPFGDTGTTMSIADITDAESLAEVRAWKKAAKGG